MAWFGDLTQYEYGARINPLGLNVGWLERGQAFETMIPTEEILDALWSFCTISVMQARGFHLCNLCDEPKMVIASRHGFRRLLGTSEIRVFGDKGLVYAAPTLIYHYVRTHHYNPPHGFLRALKESPRPPDKAYFARLEQAGFQWEQAREHPREQSMGFRSVTIDGVWQRIPWQIPTYFDED